MKYYDMTTLHDPPASVGDCWRVCIASILGMEPENVPHFAEMEGNVAARTATWLEALGYGLVQITAPQHVLAWVSNAVVYIASGPSLGRGVPHCVLSDGVDLIHDPHPSRAGLAEIKTVWLITEAAPQRREAGPDPEIWRRLAASASKAAARFAALVAAAAGTPPTRLKDWEPTWLAKGDVVVVCGATFVVDRVVLWPPRLELVPLANDAGALRDAVGSNDAGAEPEPECCDECDAVNVVVAEARRQALVRHGYTEAASLEPCVDCVAGEAAYLDDVDSGLMRDDKVPDTPLIRHGTKVEVGDD